MFSTSEKNPRVNQLSFYRKTVFANHPLVFMLLGPPESLNVVRVAVAACLWPTTFKIPSVPLVDTLGDTLGDTPG